MRRLGDGIETATTQRVTPAQPAQRQPRTTTGPVGGDRFTRVLRARRYEAARRRTVCAQLLVDVDPTKQESRGT